MSIGVSFGVSAILFSSAFIPKTVLVPFHDFHDSIFLLSFILPITYGTYGFLLCWMPGSADTLENHCEWAALWLEVSHGKGESFSFTHPPTPGGEIEGAKCIFICRMAFTLQMAPLFTQPFYGELRCENIWPSRYLCIFSPFTPCVIMEEYICWI